MNHEPLTSLYSIYFWVVSSVLSVCILEGGETANSQSKQTNPQNQTKKRLRCPGKGKFIPCPWPCLRQWWQGGHHGASSPCKPHGCCPALSRWFTWCFPSVSKALNPALHKSWCFTIVSDFFLSSSAKHCVALWMDWIKFTSCLQIS